MRRLRNLRRRRQDFARNEPLRASSAGRRTTCGFAPGSVLEDQFLLAVFWLGSFRALHASPSRRFIHESCEATSIILAEAFAENGLTMLAYRGGDPGYQRMETLIAAIRFLISDLVDEPRLSRTLVSALFTLATYVPRALDQELVPTDESRCSYYRQTIDLSVFIDELICNWPNSPDDGQWLSYDLEKPTDAAPSAPIEKFEGYVVGDITYCIVPKTEKLFPVRVIRLGFNVIEVAAITPEICREVCESFLEERLNRCFRAPSLPDSARFGGSDERPVNSARRSGPELRLLPYGYATTTGELIRQLHANDPTTWPLPTGTVFERWFRDVK